MISSSNTFLSFALIIPFLLSVSDSLVAQSSKLNRNAQALARVIAPKSPAKNADANSLTSLGEQMTKAVQILETSYRTNGPTPANLITKSLEFRNDIGPAERLVLTNTLLEAWRAANGMGLFDEHGEFVPVISKGRGVGEKSMFELIIPADVYPPISNQLANLRLIPLDQKRADGTPLTAREKATGAQLKAMIEERLERAKRAAFRKGPKTNDLGQTEKEQEKIWKAAMEEAGESAHAMPSLGLRGDMTASPSHMTGDRWRVAFEVTNSSQFPTEVKAEVWLIGYTEKERRYFVMINSTHDLKLRAGEVRNFDIHSKSRGSYKKRADEIDGINAKESRGTQVRYRGFMIKVTHETGLVEFTASDQKLLRYIDPEEEDQGLAKLPKL